MNTDKPLRPDAHTNHERLDSFSGKVATLGREVLAFTQPVLGADEEKAEGEKVEQDDMMCVPCTEPMEARIAVMAKDIHKPSAAEIALHRITHMPYRP